jgi:hypothetical protein
VIVNQKIFDAWYQRTLGPIEKQFGSGNGKAEVQELFEKNGFEFIRDEPATCREAIPA